jgi:hypothetical protein
VAPDERFIELGAKRLDYRWTRLDEALLAERAGGTRRWQGVSAAPARP